MIDDADVFLTALLPASHIPDGATVSKRTGSYRYTLTKSITLYSDAGKQVLLNNGNFLFNERGDINSIPGDTLLLWHMPRFEVERMLGEDR